MKNLWISDELHESYKKASEKTKRSIASIVRLVLTKNLNYINDTEKLDKDFSMFKENE